MEILVPPSEDDLIRAAFQGRLFIFGIVRVGRPIKAAFLFWGSASAGLEARSTDFLFDTLTLFNSYSQAVGHC